MRRLIVAAMVAASVQSAQAADLPDWGDLPVLRGGVGYARTSDWQGFYVGGQAGYGSTDVDFTGSNTAMTARLLANTVIENEMQVSQWPLFNGKTNSHQTGFGGFAGYNSQWEDVVVGVEGNYMHGRFNGSSTASVTRVSANQLTGGDYHAVTSTSTKAVSITDVGTLRARAGYVFGSFMPYVFGGLALGRGDIYSAVSVAEGYDPDRNLAVAMLHNNPVVSSTSNTQGGHLLYGYTAGLGTEINLYGNLFARAEWEYIRFVNAGDIAINTVRGGVGYKF